MKITKEAQVLLSLYGYLYPDLTSMMVLLPGTIFNCPRRFSGIDGRYEWEDNSGWEVHPEPNYLREYAESGGLFYTTPECKGEGVRLLE